MLWTEIRNTLDREVEHRCRKAGFVPTGPMGDRHGTWERVFAKATPHLRRALILDVTKPDVSSRLDIELSAAADDGQHFVRRVVQRANGVSRSIPPNLDQAIQKALAIADSLTAADLAEEYPAFGTPGAASKPVQIVVEPPKASPMPAAMPGRTMDVELEPEE